MMRSGALSAFTRVCDALWHRVSNHGPTRQRCARPSFEALLRRAPQDEELAISLKPQRTHHDHRTHTPVIRLSRHLIRLRGPAPFAALTPLLGALVALRQLRRRHHDL